MDRFFGTSSWSGELRETIIRETGLPISCGLSVNKMVSKVATGEAKPNGKLHVPGGTERGFLDPLSISKIPLIGGKTFRLLRGMGIDRVRTLRKVPVELMQQMLGKNGTLLWKRANGIDQSAVVPFSEAKSISTERTFQKDTMDIRWLKSLLTSMLEKITFQLRDSKRLAGCLTVKIRYTSFDTYTRQLKLPYTASDHVLLARALELFDKLYDRRMRLRLIGVRLSDLVHGHHQIDLFEDSHEMVRLYQAMDRIRNKYGQHKLYRATGQGMVSDKRMVNAFARD
jgi:DNA polymerase-4